MLTDNIYVGIDLHKSKFDFVMITAEGKIISSGKRSTTAQDVADFASQLDHRHQVTLEPLQEQLLVYPPAPPICWEAPPG